MATKKKRGIPFYWTRDDEKMGKLVVEKYAISSEEELLAMFPGQNMKSIGKAANKRGVKRRRKNSWVPEQEKLLSEYFPKSHDENLSDDERNKLKVELTEKINAISVKEGLTTKSWRDSILTKAIQMGHSWARNKSSGAVGKKIGNSLEEKFIAWLKKATRSIEEISEFLEIPTTKCYEFIDKLRSEGFPVETDDDKRTFFWREGVDQDGTTKLPPLSRKTFKLVVFTDPRLGHKSQQLTLLHNLYSFINRGYVNKERGIDFSDINMVVCLGNLVAGKTQRKGDSNLFLTEFEDQIDYVIDHFPVLKDGIKTYCLNGPAEFDLGKGSAKRLTRNTLQAICVARNDMVYAGDLNHTFTITGTDIKIFGDHSPGLHSPSPYTRSIPLDYLTSSFDDLSPRRRGEKPPVVTVVGGYHVPMYFPPINADSNRHAFLVSSFCDPQASSRDRKKQGSAATIGFTVITVALNENRKKVEKVLYQEHSWTNHQITDDYLTVPEYKNLSEDEDKILKGFYREGSLREGEIARRIGKSKTEARRVVKSLKRRGIDISTLDSASNSYILERRQKRSWGPSKDMKKFTRKVYAKTVDVGAYSDSHCGSIFEQPHVFREIEQIFTEAGVKIIYHSGDVHEGEDLFRGQPRTLYLHTSEEQREHAAKVLPRVKDAITLVISGSHDGIYYKKGGEHIVKLLCKIDRPDMVYLGLARGDYVHQKTGVRHRLLHPSGGVPKGRSYRPQELARLILETINSLDKDIQGLFIGHLHVAFFMRWRGIDIFMIPCCQTETDYLIPKGLVPRLGCWVVKQTLDVNNDPTLIVPIYHAMNAKKYTPEHKLVLVEEAEETS